MISLEDEINYVRSSVALAEEGRRSVLRLRGGDTDQVLEMVCPRQPFLHEGQILETLFCDDAGDIVADVLIARAEDALWLLVDGLTCSEVEKYLRDHVATNLDLEVQAQTESHDLVSVHGPYAWEFLAEALSPEIIGLPPLGCYFFRNIGCFRAGSVGEYAYQLLVPKGEHRDLEARFAAHGAAFDLGRVTSGALDVCRLENFTFNLHAEGRIVRDPLTLQLSWRLSSHRDYPGADVHRARRAAGVTHRAVLVSSQTQLLVGTNLAFEEESAGEVIASARSWTRGEWLAIAHLNVDYADPGLVALSTRDAAGRAASATVLSAPALDNRSVHTSPQRHSYGTRHDDTFPPLFNSQSRNQP